MNILSKKNISTMPDKRILHCESINSAYQSMELILHISRSEIDSVFDKIDLNEYWTKNQHDFRRPGEIILEQCLHKGCEIEKPTEIHWFHATRVIPTKSFKDGIRPLNQQIEHIWNDLFMLASNWISDTEWNRFRTALETNHNGNYGDLYRKKIDDQIHWGPYALLVKEVALKPEENMHDYLAAPEIIEDICTSFYERYGNDLLKQFRQNSRACIVTFKDSSQRLDALHSAIFYLYTVHHGQSLSLHCNTCFDAGGKAILPERILKIEYI